MKSVAQFHNGEGKAIGIPALGGLIIMDVEKATDIPNRPEKAKTLVRYIIGEEWRGVFLRDPFKHVMSSMPLSAHGPWAHCTDADGFDVAIPRNAVTFYEQIEDPQGKGASVFNVTVQLASGPAHLKLATTLDGLVEHIGLVPDQPDPVVELAEPPEEGQANASHTRQNRVEPE
jgi:hypothetical protein